MHQIKAIMLIRCGDPCSSHGAGAVVVRMVLNTVIKSKYVSADSTFYYASKYSWKEKRSAFALKLVFYSLDMYYLT